MRTTITASDSRTALKRVLETLGPDAVIIETRTVDSGVEVVAGVERPAPSPPPRKGPPVVGAAPAAFASPVVSAAFAPPRTPASTASVVPAPLFAAPAAAAPRAGGAPAAPRTPLGAASPHPASAPAPSLQPKAALAAPEVEAPASGEVDLMVKLIAQARAVGVDPELLSADIAGAGTRLEDADDLADIWTSFVRRVEHGIEITGPAHAGVAHVCVVGDSGSAKTTTLVQMACAARRERPSEAIALLAGDTRIGAREQLRVIGHRLDVAVLEPRPDEALADVVARAGRGRRLFIDMPSDPRLAARTVAALRERLPRADALTILCTLPLTGQLARHRQIIDLFSDRIDGTVVTHAGEVLPPGAVITALLDSAMPLAYIGRSADLAQGLSPAWSTSLCQMVAMSLAECRR